MEREQIQTLQATIQSGLSCLGETPQADQLIVYLLMFSFAENMIIPKLLVEDTTQLTSPAEVRRFILANFSRYFKIITSGARSQNVLELEWIHLKSSLEFCMVISRFSRNTVFKIILINRITGMDAYSVLIDTAPYFQITQEGKYEAISTSEMQQLLKVTKSLLDPILRDWNLWYINLPSTVSDSNDRFQAPHLRMALNLLVDNEKRGRNLLILLICTVLSERGLLPKNIQHSIAIDPNDQRFSYEKHFCLSVAGQFLQIQKVFDEIARNVISLEFTHKSSSLSFNVIIGKYKEGSFKVTFIHPRQSNTSLGLVFDVGKCFVQSTTTGEFNYKILSIYAKDITDKLLNPILFNWWQEQRLHTRLPYLLGIPENCHRRILAFLPRPRDKLSYRQTSRMINQFIS